MADALVKSLERSGKTKPDHSAKPPEPAPSLKHDNFFSDHSNFFTYVVKNIKFRPIILVVLHCCDNAGSGGLDTGLLGDLDLARRGGGE